MPASLNEEARAVVVCWTTGQRVLRTDWLREPFLEELSVEEGAIDLARLNAGAPLLNSHRNEDLKDHIGVVESAWIEGGRGFARIRFSKRKEVEPIFQDIKDGILRNVSVGYRILEAQKDEGQNPPLLRVLKWEPLELSLVSIPADSGASVRSQERQRIQGILDLGVSHDLPNPMIQEMIDSGLGPGEARGRALAGLGERTQGNRIDRGVTVTRDGGDTVREAMARAIFARSEPGTQDDMARSYQHMSLPDMARVLVGGGGSREEVVRRAFHSSKDFPEILGEAARRKLLSSYEKLAQKQNFWPLVRIRGVSDFKPMRLVRLGEMPNMELLEEGAPVSLGSIGEAASSYQIATYGKALGISRQMVINDDLGAFDQLGHWGGAIARLESKLFWDILNQNQKVSDGLALFSKEHKNIGLKPMDLNIESLSQARISMARQEGIDKREGEYLDIQPEFLIVPPELQTQGEQLVSRDFEPTSPDGVNPFKGVLKVITTSWLKDPKAWYLASGLGQGVDLVEMAYLDGVRAPHVEWKTDFDTDTLKVKARFDVGCKAIDHRGFYRGGI
jgi:hypothetical protein